MNHAISLPTTVYWGNNLPISSDNEPENHFMAIISVCMLCHDIAFHHASWAFWNRQGFLYMNHYKTVKFQPVNKSQV